MTRSRPLLAALTAAALLTAGCTSAHDPQPNYSSVSTTPTTSSPTESNSPVTPNTTANVPPGAVAPTLPAASRANTSDGAFSFAPYYWQMVSWAYATNDGSVIDGLYAPSCKSCASFSRNIKQNVAAGYRLSGGLITIKSVSVSDDLNGTPGAQYAVDVSLSVDPLAVKDEKGKTVQTYPSTSDRQRLYLAWSGQWQVVDTAKVVQ